MKPKPGNRRFQVAGTTEKQVWLYRAVSPGELRQFAYEKRFRTVPDSVEGKYFAETPEHAIQWGKRFYKTGNYKIIEVGIPPDVADRFWRWEELDKIGPARFADVTTLVELLFEEVQT